MMQPRNQLKTAFLQLKAGDSYSGEIEEHQLKCASVSPIVASRSFVVHVNSAARDIRVADLSYLLKKRAMGKPVRFHSHRWSSLGEWLSDWLQCRVGEPSVLGDAQGPAALLSYYASNRVPYFGFDHNEDAPAVADAVAHLPPGFLPARAWLTSSVESLE